MKSSVRKISQAVSLALIAGASSTVQASGFALIENSASGMGNAFAGAAAIAEDASTIWFNPAGMTKLSGSRISVAGHIISPSSEFTNSNSTMLDGNPLPGPDGKTDVTKFVPNFYYITSLNEDWTFGLGINAPFGLETDYDTDWIGRYHATHSDMMTININPSLAVKANDKLSIGFGFNFQYVDVTLKNQLDSAQICTALMAQNPLSPTYGNINNSIAACAGNPLFLDLGDPTTDSSQSMSGDDWSWGLNFGILYDFTPDTRLGVAYRSGVNHDLQGDVDFTLTPALDAMITNDWFSDSAITAHTEFPDTLSFSVLHQMDSSITLLADATLTRWKSFDELKINFVDTTQYDAVTPENWTNSWRFSLGVNYKAGETLTYRIGIALDQTPVDTAEDRTARIPDNDRTWLSIGLGYALNSDMSLDVGYAHLFVDDTDINNDNNTNANFAHTLNGSYESSVDILSAQFNMKF